MRLLFLIFFSLSFGCNAKAEDYEKSWHNVPFVSLDKEKKTSLEFKPQDILFRIKNENDYINLEPKNLPLKIIEHKENKIIFSKKLFDGENRVSIFNKNTFLKDIELPKNLKKFLFMNAAIGEKEIVVIYYNPVAFRHFFYRINLSDYSFDELWTREANWGDKHISNHSLCINVFHFSDPEYGDKKAIHFIAGNVVYIYRNIITPSFDRFEFPKNCEFLTYRQEGDRFIGFFKKSGFSDKIDNTKLIQAIDLKTRNETSDLFEFTKYKIEQTIESFEPSGILNMGNNNEEGLVPWSQTYYLNGLINLLQNWKMIENHLTDEIIFKLKSRLMIEIYLLDRLINEYGLISLRYSVDRLPIFSMLHSARVYRVLRRYEDVLISPFELISKKYIELLFSSEKEQNFFESIIRSNNDGMGLKKGECYLTAKKNAPFPHDGLNLPYNYMNSLTSELPYMNLKNNSSQKDFIKDASIIFLRNEEFNKHFPQNFEWHYSWGKMREGREAKENISINLPSYPPDNSMAHISYKSIDLIGLLTVLKFHPDIFPKGFKEYTLDAVKKGTVYPFVYEELKDQKCDLDENVAHYYSLPLAPWELQNASIAWLYLLNKTK
ncbi:MAG: hypothetical protein Q8L85_01885 [Alphaproteobacteria bacterium]|nr:hypothetical protein [Alphaproteobacteria bacterium]